MSRVDSEYLINAVYDTVSMVGNSSIPFQGYMKIGWSAMTDRFSHFTISVVFSVLLHEVLL